MRERAKDVASERPRRRPHWETITFGLILLAALILRIAYLVEAQRSPDFRFPPVDAGFHDYWARALLSGDWTRLPADAAGRDPEIRRHPYFRPPGYPYFLAGAYLVTGSSHVGARIVQMFLGLINCALAYLLARRLFGRAVGLMTAAMTGLYWLFIYFEAHLQAPVLLIFLSLCIVHACRRIVKGATWPRSVLVGVLVGVCALVRPNVLLFVPVLLLWGLWLLKRQSRFRAWPRFVVGTAIGVAAAVMPVTLRNYLVSGETVLISANAGVNLYIGNNIRARGRFVDDLPDLGHFRTCFDYPAIIARLEKNLSRKLDYSDTSAFFADKAWQFIRDHPADFGRLLLTKTALFWGPRELTHNNAVRYDREFSRVLRYLPGNFALVLGLGLTGMLILAACRIRGRMPIGVHAPRQDEAFYMSALMTLFVLTYFASFLPFFVTSLYRAPILPFLLIFASVAAVHVVLGLVSPRRIRPLAWAAAAATLCLALHVPLFQREKADAANLARWHFAQAVCYRLDGDTDAAISSYRRALEADPRDSRSHNNLASLLHERGLSTEASRHYRDALRLNPNFEEALCGVGNVMADAGRLQDAILYYARAAALNPEYVEARFGLANALARTGRYPDAISEYRYVLLRRPGFVDAHSNLGVVLATVRRYDDAIGHYREVLRLHPRHAAAHANMGIAFECQGRAAEAAQQYRHAIRINPADRGTRDRLTRLVGTAQ